MPVLTRNSFGKGEAWYVATSPDDAFLNGLVRQLCDQKDIQPVLVTPENVEATKRVKNGKEYTFVLNHTDIEQTVQIGERNMRDLLTDVEYAQTLTIAGKGVAILEEVR